MAEKLIPNHFDVVQKLYAELKPDLTKHDECGKFTHSCAVELHKIDPEFGHLIKKGSQNKYDGHAVDAILYKKVGRTVDIIGSSASPKADIRWGENVNDKYTDADWRNPLEVPNPNPNPVPSNNVELDKLKKENESLKKEIATEKNINSSLNNVIAEQKVEIDKLRNKSKPVGYDQFVSEESLDVLRTFKQRRSHEPAASDYYHNAYRRLVEGWSHEDIIKDI